MLFQFITFNLCVVGGMFDYYDKDDIQPLLTTIMQIKQSGC